MDDDHGANVNWHACIEHMRAAPEQGGTNEAGGAAAQEGGQARSQAWIAEQPMYILSEPAPVMSMPSSRPRAAGAPSR